MKNPFAADVGGDPRLKRNPVDLSRQNLFSTHWGRITPAFMQEVIPGQSVELSSSLAIQGMPTVFPLQTKVRVSVEYFYSRNRTVHDNFEDFIFRTKSIEQPWLRMDSERAKKMISTGSLGDFFGLATSYVQASPVFDEQAPTAQYNYTFNAAASFTQSRTQSSVVSTLSMAFLNGLSFSSGNLTNSLFRGYHTRSTDFVVKADKVFYSKPYITTSSALPSPQSVVFFIHDADNHLVLTPITGYVGVEPVYGTDSATVRTFYQIDDSIPFTWEKWTKLALDSVDSYYIMVCSFVDSLSTDHYDLSYTDYFPSVPSSNYFYPDKFSLPKLLTGTVDATDDLVIGSNPYVGSSPDIPVNALPYRHYEQICNYYFRNDKNNPYVLGGEVQYNEFIPTHSDGADDNIYDFHYKNWELDRFTSAVQSPQFGEAPLVGLTYTGSDTVKLEFEADGQTYTADVGVDDDNVVTTISDFSKDIPSANLDKLRQMIQYGISINDLRVTNSFQRFLENVLRRGLRYRNQLKSHFGVSVDYPDIDVPQYIGGYSGVLEVGKVTSTAQTSQANLGDFNGSLSGMVSSKHKIHCYCPEHGFIFGMVTITPIPVYTQVTNKVMLKHDPFDYFLPEFGKIGFVPMHYSEVMPLQTPADGSVHDVFGYQKAWYDYMRSFDEAHGYFRTNLKDFLVQRVFAERPELVEDFTVINPDQLTDVFVVQNVNDEYKDISDKFLCNFYVQCRSLVPIPINGTPSLE